MPIRTIAKKLISFTRKFAPAPAPSAEPVRFRPLPSAPAPRPSKEELIDRVKLGELEEAAALYQRLSMGPDGGNQELTDTYVQALFENGHFEAVRAIDAQSGCRILKLASAEEWANQKKYPVLSAGEIEEIPVSRPPVLGALGLQSAEMPPKVVRSTKPYVAELHNVTVSSRSSVIVTPDGYALNDVAAHPKYGADVSLQYDKTILSKKDGYVLARASYPITKIEAGIFLCGLGADYFGHWVPEFLNKLKFYEYHPDFKKLPIIVDANMPESHFDYLSALIENPLLKLPDQTSLCCERLLVAPTATFYPVELVPNHDVPQHEIGPLSPAGLRWIQNRVLSKFPVTSTASTIHGRKLYLSRRNMIWRKATNDEEISEFLEKKGFETVDVEKLTFPEQVRLFRMAECIVAPNGSSMLNIIFAPQDVKLVVLSQPDVFNWGGYYGPVNALGYNMLFVAGDEAEPVGNILYAKHANYHVPIERIEEALSRYA